MKKYLVKVESDKDELGSIFVEVKAETPKIAVEEVKKIWFKMRSIGSLSQKGERRWKQKQ